LSLWRDTSEKQLKRGQIGSLFQRFHSVPLGSIVSGPMSGETEHQGGECVGQSADKCHRELGACTCRHPSSVVPLGLSPTGKFYPHSEQVCPPQLLTYLPIWNHPQTHPEVCFTNFLDFSQFRKFVNQD
jgi:hypothetical protein